MSDRHQILSDTAFWTRLEYDISDWFQFSGGDAFRGFWCDGVIPYSARNTKTGVEVEGIAWIVEKDKSQIDKRRKSQGPYAFVAEIPQSMLSRRRSDILLTVTNLDERQRKICFSVTPAARAGAEARKIDR